jgi:hypothetical protein
VEELIARWFPRRDVAASVTPLPCPGAGLSDGWGRLEPLSPGRVRVEFTARSELSDKLEEARQLLSHAIPSGDLGELMERALDALLEKEKRRRFGADRPRRRRPLKEGSRHVPVEVARAVWERDGARCAFVDGEGRRCTEQRFLTIEHRMAFVCGGPPTVENLCLYCKAHNLDSARQVFGEEHIEASIRAKSERAPNAPASAPASRAAPEDVLAALCRMGFKRREAAAAVGSVAGSEPGLTFEQLLRKSLALLVRAA